MNYECLGCGRESHDMPCDWHSVILEINEDPRQTGRICVLVFCSWCEPALNRLIKKLKLKHCTTNG